MKYPDLNTYAVFGIYGFAAAAPFSNAAMETAIVYLAVVWIAALIADIKVGGGLYRRRFRWNWITVGIAAYIAVQIAAGALSERPLYSMLRVKEEWIILLYCALVGLLVSRRIFLRALYILAVSCSISGVYAVIQHFTGINLFRDLPLTEYGGYFRSGGFFGFCLTFGGFILIVFTVMLGSFYGSVKFRDKALFGMASAATYAAAVASYARSSWTGAIAGSVILSFIYHWKTGLKYAAVLLLFWIGIYLFHPTLITEHGVTSMTDPEYSEGSKIRIELWQKGMALFKDHLVLGVGPGNFQYFLKRYGASERTASLTHPHNDVLNAAVQTGILGAAAFLWIWLAFIWKCCAFWRQEKNRDSLTAGAVLGCGGAIVGILAAGMFQCYYTDIEVGMIWWYITGLAAAVISLPSKEENA